MPNFVTSLNKTVAISTLLIISITLVILFSVLKVQMNEPLYALADKNPEIQSYLSLSEIYLVEIGNGAQRFGYDYKKSDFASEGQIDLSNFYRISMWLNLGVAFFLMLSLSLLIALMSNYTNKFYKTKQR